MTNDIEWRPVPNWPKYEVSRCGKVRIKETGQVIKLRKLKRVSGTVDAAPLVLSDCRQTLLVVPKLVKEVWGE